MGELEYAALLNGRVAVVTGGGAGIGRAIATLLARHGARVEIAEIDAARGADAAREIGASARAHAVDVRDEAAVRAFAGAVLAEHGRVDVLVNNVGDYLRAVPFSRSDPAHWDALYRVN